VEFFFFLLFSLSHYIEIRAWPSKKQLCPLVCDLINFGLSSFDHYLFGFWCFFIFFNFVLGHFIQFDFIIRFGPFIFYCSIFYVLYFSLLIFFCNVPSNFIAFVFLICFWSSFFWLIYFYPFLDLFFSQFCP
jgi:hypothetical protein